ncbi:SET and MYND domain containing, class 3 isoform X2 [Lasioglossum baleicum]|uniref:SET and MYND domain containing, class 3 isoform X2 n=1 Tax=Lasioglossum baleicum TaxID=434251 RepID=UPI003FCD9A0C
MKMRIKNGYKRPPIDKGTTILTAKPFAYVLRSSYRKDRCDHCLQSGKLSKCSACQYVYYCNRSCQQGAWSIHKTECAKLKKVSPKIVPDLTRLMTRIIIKLNRGGGEETGYYTDTSFRKFKDLMSHYSDIKKDEKRMEHFMCVQRILNELFENEPMPSNVELIGIYGRICINSFNILNLDMNSIGVGIYLGPSIIDHSCTPNAVATFEGSTLLIRTIQDLPCLDWSQIRISYIDVLKLTKDRRAELQSSYYFWCNCKRCEQPELTTGAAMCPNKSCMHPCSPAAGTCENCQTQFPEKFQETFDEISDFTAYHLQKTSDLDVSKVCLKKQEGVLHPLNTQHVQTLQSAFDSSISLQHWDEAESYAKSLINGYLTYYGEIHPLTGILYLMMGKIQLYLEKPIQALEALKRAKFVLTITHGEKHTLVREKLKPLLHQAVMEGM